MPDSLAEVAFAIPGDIDTPTGGYIYDRRLLELLPSYGISARHIVLPAGYPRPGDGDLAETTRLLAATSPSTRLIIDGLAYGAMPVDLIARLDRRIIALHLGHKFAVRRQFSAHCDVDVVPVVS